MRTDIPSGWKMRKLGELSSFQNGAAFKPTEWSPTGKPIIRIQNLNGGNDFNYFDGEIDKKFGVSDGDLLFCWSGSRGTSFGPRYWHGPNGWLNQHIFNCHPAEGISKEYLYFLLDQLTLQIEMQAHGGAGLVHIKKSELVKFEYAIPEPSEQDRIAEILTSVDDSIRATEAVIAQAERVKLGLMDDLLNGGFGNEAIARGEVPEGWKATTASEIAVTKGLQTGPFGSQLKASEYYDGESEEVTHVVMPKDIVDGVINFSTCARITNERADALEKHKLQKGDVLFARRGDLSKVAVFDGEENSAICGTGCLRLRPNMNLVTYDFLRLVFTSHMSVQWLIAHAVGATMPNLNTEIIGKLPLATPPIDEQERISGSLNSIEREISANSVVRNQLKRLKRGLMDDLLTGRVRTV